MALKKNRRRFAFIAILLSIALLVIVLGTAAVILLLRNPLGEPMSLVFGTPTSSGTQLSPAKVERLASPTPAELPTEAVTIAPSPTTAPTQAPVEAATGACGNHGSLMLLFIGEDFPAGDWPLGADAVRVVKIDFDNQNISIVAFPRDLWLTTNGLSSQNISATRLGLSYYYAKTAALGPEKHQMMAATTQVGQTLYDNFGVAPQTYLTIKMDYMGSMVDAIGGLNITLPDALVSDHGIHYPAGLQRWDGYLAREYVRSLQPGGDTARRQRQNLFVNALQENMLKAGTLARIPELAVQFKDAMATDLSPELIGQMTCMLQTVPDSQVSFHEVAGDLVTARDIGEKIPVLDPKVDQIKAKLRDWLGE